MRVGPFPLLCAALCLTGCPISSRTPPDASVLTGDAGTGSADAAPAPADASTPPDAAEPPEDAPWAYAGPDLAVLVAAAVALDGSASKDPGGGSLTFAWTLRSRPAGSSATLAAATTSTPKFTADKAGAYVVDLLVSNSKAVSTLDTVLVRARASATLADDPSLPARIVVTDQVIQRDVEPIGMNLTHLTGGTNFATNQHFYGTGFEPMVMRKLIRLDRAGQDAKGQWLEWDGAGGVHNWETLATGFGNGATLRFYRLVDAAGSPLPFADGLTDPAGADHVVLLGSATVPGPSADLPGGGWISEGTATGAQNRVYVDKALGLARGDYAFLYLERTSVPQENLDPRLHQYFNGNFQTMFVSDSGTTADLVAHPAPIPAEMATPGKTCLRLTATAAAKQQMGQYLFHPYDAGEGQWYSQLHPGATYRISAWLRQEGLGDGGKVRATFVGNAAYTGLAQATPWAVTGEWQQYTYDFVAPAYPASGSHSAPGLEFTGPGKLYVDDLLLFRNDAKHGMAPFGPHENSLDPFLASVAATGRKPAVRFYPLSYGTLSVEALLGGGDGNASYSVNDGAFSAFTGVTLLHLMNWALATGASPETRVVPFLTFSEKYTEDEWAAIVEYLGVPYDAATDTPLSKPWAYRRSLQRKSGAPWTDEFREVVLEYGNETWHNGAGGYGWDGFSAPGAVHQGGREYGLFARYVFQEKVMASPAWAQHRLGDKIKLALGANYDATLEWGGSYGEAAVQQSRAVRYLGHANYVGPKWETGDSGSSVFDAHGLQETLMGLPTGMQELIESAAALRRKLNGTTGTRYRLEAYEGGPSGYWTNQANPEIDEQYGKSLAMGVAALDTWLFSSQAGYVHQCYLGYGSGRWWTSHTPPEAGGFRAHPGWLALALRNVHAPGDEMLAVDFESLPAYDRAKATGAGTPQVLPLISAYALRDATATYVFVLSRKLAGNHDGYDFGTGATPVTLALPFASPPSEITLHKLAHADGTAADPAEGNRTSEAVAIHTQTIPGTAYKAEFPIDATTGATSEGMPPGTAFLYVFKK